MLDRLRRGLHRALAAWAVVCSLALPALAQKSEDCLMCHSEPSLTMKKGGRTVSLFVDAAQLKSSAHGSADCVDCHPGLDPSETPHAKAIRPVSCQACHEIDGFEKSVHGRSRDIEGKPTGRTAASCTDCHGSHGILPPGDAKSPASRGHLSETCGKCHANVERSYVKSAHGRALEEGIKGAPSCVNCHGEHDVEETADPLSPVSKSRQAKMCEKCHLDDPEVRKLVGPAAGFIASYESSVHGMAVMAGNANAATCGDCHGAHTMERGSDSASSVSRRNIPSTCGRCHTEIAAIYNDSIHGKALMTGHGGSPSCTQCHGEHQILGPKDPRSPVSGRNVSVQVCAPCHGSLQLSLKYGLPTERFRTFEDSYHGLASRGGSAEVANCASCHGVHNIKPSSDPTSMISKDNLAKTCGSCHPGAAENFAQGTVHLAIASGENKLLDWIRVFYLWLIAGTVGGMALHNFLDFRLKTRHLMAVRRGLLPQHHCGTAQYLRMTLNERLQHGFMAGSFILLVITGFMLRFPDAWWVLSIRRLSENTFEYRSLIHRIAGVVMIAISAYHLAYVAATIRGRRLLRDLLPRVQDVWDVLGQIRFYLGLSRQKPRFHRFGYIEKAEYWALVWGVVVMAITGVIMWFDNFFMNLFTKNGWDIARTVHYYEAILATLAIIVWHFYFVMFNPDVYPMNTAWLTGKLSEEEMEKEHPLELEDIRSAQMRESES